MEQIVIPGFRSDHSYFIACVTQRVGTPNIGNKPGSKWTRKSVIQPLDHVLACPAPVSRSDFNIYTTIKLHVPGGQRLPAILRNGLVDP